MGLKLTVPKECNYMHYDFENAYWNVTHIMINTEAEEVGFILNAYPSRESAKNEGKVENKEYFSIGTSGNEWLTPVLYTWSGIGKIRDVFPNGIPSDRNGQMTCVYNFVKEYTALPFQDVFEETTDANP